MNNHPFKRDFPLTAGTPVLVTGRPSRPGVVLSLREDGPTEGHRLYDVRLPGVGTALVHGDLLVLR